MTSSRDIASELHDAFAALVGLARQASDPSAVDYALLRLQLVLKTQVTGIEMALATLAEGPAGIGAACFEDVRTIAVRKVELIGAVVDDLPRLAADRCVVDLRPDRQPVAPDLTG
jgi:hypothetical protein